MITSNVEMATTILKQLANGTGRLKIMIGAYNFVTLDNGVEFRFKSRNKLGANYCRIILNGKDLYDVTLSRIHGTKITVKAEADDLYNDQLKVWFESTTELYLSL